MCVCVWGGTYFIFRSFSALRVSAKVFPSLLPLDKFFFRCVFSILLAGHVYV